MKKAYLFGHTGSINRGCEAIVRSTSHILKKSGYEQINLFIGDQEYDKKLGVDEVVDFLPLEKCSKFFRGICYVLGSRFKIVFPAFLRQKAQAKKIGKDSPAFVIGGDTYCYGFPYNFIGFNKAARSKNIKTILWGCSVDERIHSSKAYIKDLNNYSYIVARETLSYQILEQVLEDKSKLFLACDPAFHLPIKEVALPVHFAEGNTVGLNLSKLVFTNYQDKGDIMRKNVSKLIDFILNETDMHLCLIPHVYDSEKNLQDTEVIHEIMQDYGDNDRIAVVDKNLSCEELKFIISKCNFFVGARTHSMIAAYSTAVPALALSYSIKSRGIAKDLYGDEEFAIRYKAVESETQLVDAFQSLMRREEEIRKKYSENLENYKKTIFDAVSRL